MDTESLTCAHIWVRAEHTNGGSGTNKSAQVYLFSLSSVSMSQQLTTCLSFSLSVSALQIKHFRLKTENGQVCTKCLLHYNRQYFLSWPSLYSWTMYICHMRLGGHVSHIAAGHWYYRFQKQLSPLLQYTLNTALHCFFEIFGVWFRELWSLFKCNSRTKNRTATFWMSD